MRILVVEDELKLAAFIKTGLEEQACAVEVAYDGILGRQLALHHTYDVIVLDVNLPGISGPELLHILTDDAAWTRPPVFLVSSDVGQPGVPEALRAGRAVAALQKPFDIDELIELIECATRGDVADPALTG